MRKAKIWTVSLLLFSIIMVFSINMITNPITMPDIENGGSNEELNISTESGGGYLMNTDATYSWIEIQTTGNPMTISNFDDHSEEISFISNGWTFTFYETVYDTIEVSTNGWMSFTDLGDTFLFCDNLPSAEIDNFDCVALLSEDLDPSYSGNIYYQFFGSGPNRYLVIEYNQMYTFGEESVGDFEVIFYENGNIKFQYKMIHDIQWFFPIIGLDHGDLTNYNRFDAELPLNSKAIEFTFNKMIEIEYGLNFSIEDAFSWLVLEVDHTKMDQFFGITWETDFGLYPNMLINEKTQINVSSIKENSTHWEINYNTWDWIDRNATFSSSYDGNDSILYRKEPLNYTIPHILSNHYPFLLPNFTLLYLSRANLDNYYDYIVQYNFDHTVVESYFHISTYDVIVDAFYSSSGILEELKVIYGYEDDENYITEIIFLMVRYIEGPKPFYVGVSEGEIYEYGVFYSVKNAPPGFSQETFENFPDRIRFSVDFIGGEDPELNRSLVIITLSGRINDIWTAVMIYENYLYRTTENIEFLLYMGQYVESITVNWESYALIIENSYNRIMPGIYTVTPLDDGLKISIGIMGYNLELITTYNSSIGVLNILSEHYNGKEFITYRLNDFDYRIKEAEEAIPGVNIIILSFIILTGIISIAWQIRRKITLK